MHKSEFISCRLDPQTLAKFNEAAVEEKRPPSQLLRVLVEQFVEEREEQAESSDARSPRRSAG